MIQKQGMKFKIEVRDHNIRTPIAIHIASIYSHACPCIAIPVVSNFCFQPGIRKCAVVLVKQQEIGRGVARYEQVRPAVIVEVNCYNPQSSAHELVKTRRMAHVREGTVAIIVIEGQRHSLVGALLAVRSNIEILALERGALERKLRIIADDKIEESIAIVVEPSGARGPSSGVLKPCVRGDVSECAIAVVVVKRAFRESGDEDVRMAIVVEISDGYTHTVILDLADSRVRGDIHKFSVA